MAKLIICLFGFALGGINLTFADANAPSRFKVAYSLDIAEVPAGFPVNFCLLTAGKTQYVAYYDKQHSMTIASRTLDSTDWKYQVLPTKIGWDTHNYINMAVDDNDDLHVSGNMHAVPMMRLSDHHEIDYWVIEIKSQIPLPQCHSKPAI